jgi:hypothetical protein
MGDCGVYLCADREDPCWKLERESSQRGIIGVVSTPNNDQSCSKWGGASVEYFISHAMGRLFERFYYQNSSAARLNTFPQLSQS